MYSSIYRSAKFTKLLPCILAFLRLSQLNCFLMASLMAQMVKNLPAMWETRVQSLGRERFPGKRHGNPLQYSCLEDPMDRGA